MNLYSINTVRQEFSFLPLVYTISQNDYSESLTLKYTDQAHKLLSETIQSGGPMLSSWMELLDYDAESKPSSTEAFVQLQDTLALLGFSDEFSVDSIALFIKGIDKTAFVDLASSVLDLIKECFDLHPALVYLYPGYYTLLHTLYIYTESSVSLDAASALYTNCLLALSKELLSLHHTLESAQGYAQAVFITPYADNSSIPCSAAAALYHSYCGITNAKDFYFQNYDYPTGASFTGPSASEQNITWEAYLTDLQQTVENTNTKSYPITSLAQFLHIGFSQLISNGSIIRKCKLCNGYFLTKYASDQMYCSRVYKNTSATCSEVGVRKTYKEKLFKHPIHQEFTKSYNKLYGRIRRGKVPADSPLMDELKRLHDEYTEKYENTHTKDREAVWKEYIQKNKELLG
jgi:hypothetical protein